MDESAPDKNKYKDVSPKEPVGFEEKIKILDVKVEKKKPIGLGLGAGKKAILAKGLPAHGRNEEEVLNPNDLAPNLFELFAPVFCETSKDKGPCVGGTLVRGSFLRAFSVGLLGNRGVRAWKDSARGKVSKFARHALAALAREALEEGTEEDRELNQAVVDRLTTDGGVPFEDPEMGLLAKRYKVCIFLFRRKRNTSGRVWRLYFFAPEVAAHTALGDWPQNEEGHAYKELDDDEEEDVQWLKSFVASASECEQCLGPELDEQWKEKPGRERRNPIFLWQIRSGEDDYGTLKPKSARAAASGEDTPRTSESADDAPRPKKKAAPRVAAAEEGRLSTTLYTDFTSFRRYFLENPDLWRDDETLAEALVRQTCRNGLSVRHVQGSLDRASLLYLAQTEEGLYKGLCLVRWHTSKRHKVAVIDVFCVSQGADSGTFLQDVLHDLKTHRAARVAVLEPSAVALFGRFYERSGHFLCLERTTPQFRKELLGTYPELKGLLPGVRLVAVLASEGPHEAPFVPHAIFDGIEGGPLCLADGPNHELFRPGGATASLMGQIGSAGAREAYRKAEGLYWRRAST